MRAERIEILTEEPSMKNALEILLPRVLPEGFVLQENCFVRPHEGKSDLQKSLRKKVKAYPYFGYPVILIVVHDQDSNDCISLKNKISEIINEVNPKQVRLIRIACTELENWYLGDMPAIERVYPTFKASKFIKKAKFRNPDRVTGSAELEKILHGKFTKSFASKNIPIYMNLQGNNSPSFNQFLTGLQKILSK